MRELVVLVSEERDKISEILEKNGYTTVSLNKISELKNIKEIGCAILDISSPNFKGFFTFFNRKKIPIIVLVSNTDVDLAMRHLRKGAFDFALKPISEKDILYSVSKTIEIKRIMEERRRMDKLIDKYFEKVDEKVEEIVRDIRESEQRYKELIENSGDGFFVTDLRGTIVYVNQSFSRIFGYPKEQLIGKNIIHLIHPQDINIFIKIFKKDYKIPRLLEVRCLKKRKTEVYLQISITRVKKGGIVKIQGIARDITELKIKEKELKRLNKELFLRQEKLVALTAELERKNKELMMANSLKDIFLDVMSHDLLNPVGIILNISEIALTENSIEDIKEEIKIIKRNAEKIKELVENATFLAKIEKIDKVSFEYLDLDKIIEEAVEDLTYYINEKKISLELKLIPCKIEANPIIKEVFINLISNAIKYSPKGSKVVVGIEEKGDRVVVYVKDYGIGVPDEYKLTIFDRFTRIEKKGVRGSGIGLAIVKRLVELHKGEVWVENNPEGKGSIFYVEIPKKQKNKN